RRVYVERGGAVATDRAHPVRERRCAARRDGAARARAEAPVALRPAAPGAVAAPRRRSFTRARARLALAQEEPLIQFDPYSDAQRNDPYPAYAELRRHSPVTKIEKMGAYV